ncbi:hypothetical protein V8G54_029333, partial [Vigna mungo]
AIVLNIHDLLLHIDLLFKPSNRNQILCSLPITNKIESQTHTNVTTESNEANNQNYMNILVFVSGLGITQTPTHTQACIAPALNQKHRQAPVHHRPHSPHTKPAQYDPNTIIMP